MISLDDKQIRHLLELLERASETIERIRNEIELCREDRDSAARELTEVDWKLTTIWAALLEASNNERRLG